MGCLLLGGCPDPPALPDAPPVGLNDLRIDLPRVPTGDLQADGDGGARPSAAPVKTLSLGAIRFDNWFSAAGATQIDHCNQRSLYPVHPSCPDSSACTSCQGNCCPPTCPTSCLFPPGHLNFRLPWFAVFRGDGTVDVRSDTQAIMNLEITYAEEGGLDYFAFDWRHPEAWTGLPWPADRWNNGLYLFLKAPPSRLTFALALMASQLTPRRVDDSAAHLPHYLDVDWADTVARLVAYFGSYRYHTIVDPDGARRPLVYVYGVQDFIDQWGRSPDHQGEAPAVVAGKKIDELRRAVRDRGLGELYLVCMNGKSCASWVGGNPPHLDAVSAYTGATTPNAPSNPDHTDAPLPYAVLREDNRKLWEAMFAMHAADNRVSMIPIVNSGWDYRPKSWWNSGVDGKAYFAKADPGEIRDQLREAIRFVREHPSESISESVLIYAWNEFSEGGWLTPTPYDGPTIAGDGNRRLEGIAELKAPIARWRLDGDTSDSSPAGQALAASWTGPERYAPSQRGSAAQLDGSNFLQVADHAALDGMDELTLAAWVKLDHLPPSSKHYPVLSKDSTGQSYRLIVTAQGQVQFAIATTAAGEEWYKPGTSATSPQLLQEPPPRWYHLAGTYDGRRVRVYVDGLLRGEGIPPAGAISGRIKDSASPVYLGHSAAQNAVNLEGFLDEVEIYGRALPDAEMSGWSQ